MQYILLLQYNNGDQDYYDFTNEKDAEEKMGSMKRYASTIIEHAWIVETKIIKHWANPSVSEDGVNS